MLGTTVPDRASSRRGTFTPYTSQIRSAVLDLFRSDETIFTAVPYGCLHSSSVRSWANATNSTGTTTCYVLDNSVVSLPETRSNIIKAQQIIGTVTRQKRGGSLQTLLPSISTYLVLI